MRRKAKACRGRTEGEAAALIRACAAGGVRPAVLIDWLQDRAGLGAAAALLRSSEMNDVPPGWGERCEGLAFAPLAPDAVIWAARSRDGRERAALGLLAHPPRRPRAWARLAFLVPCDSLLEAALAELRDRMGRGA